MAPGKKIAEKMIIEGEEDTRFFGMTIDFFTGLKYIGEGSGDNKNQLIDMIKKKVKKKRIPRYVEVWNSYQCPLVLKKKISPPSWNLHPDGVNEKVWGSFTALKPFIFSLILSRTINLYISSVRACPVS